MRWLADLFAGGLLKGVRGIVTAVAGDKEQRDQQAADDLVALRKAVAAEFTAPERRGWWNAFIDGLNRLPRPVMTFGTIGLFVWAAVDPARFSVAMQAIALVPQPLWVLMGTIVTFWFGHKTLQGLRAPKVDPVAVERVVERMDDMRRERAPAPSPAPSEADRMADMLKRDKPLMTDAEYREQMQRPEPMKLDAIVEWNRRQKAKE